MGWYQRRVHGEYQRDNWRRPIATQIQESSHQDVLPRKGSNCKDSVKSKQPKGNKERDTIRDAPIVVPVVEVEEEVKKKDSSHSDHGRDYRERKRDRVDRKKEDKKEKTRDRSPVGRKGSREGRKSRDYIGMGYTGSGGRKQQSNVKEDEKEKEQPVVSLYGGRKQQGTVKDDEVETEQPIVRETAQWEGFGWSSRKRGQEPGRLSSDSDE